MIKRPQPPVPAKPIKQHGMPAIRMTPRPRLSGRDVIMTGMVLKTR